MDNATQKSSENELNQLNLAMRSQPWYQQFFSQRGLDPNQVKLNESQRAQLAQLANSNGYKIGDRMKIDPAGNINQKGGFAGMPTWAKVAITAAAIAGTGGALGAAGIGPMAGMMGGGGGASGAAGAAGATAAGGAGTAASAIPTIGSTIYGTGMGVTPSLLGSTAAGAGSMAGGLAGAGGAASSGGSLISKFMGKGQNLADAGKLFQSFANDEAGERYNQTANNNNYDQLRLAAAQNRRTDESDAMKKLSQAGYIKSGGSPFDASKVQLSGGRSLPSFSFPRAPITDEMKAGATTLEEQMLKRLQPDGSFTPTPNESGNRGVGEQIGRFGSLATTGLGFLSNYFDRK